MFGKKKYARNNWKKGFVKEELLDSLMRHVLALQNGEEFDPEHGLPHTEYYSMPWHMSFVEETINL
jgi:hypothetical protein